MRTRIPIFLLPAVLLAGALCAEDAGAKAGYWLPFEAGTARLLVQGNDTKFSHTGNQKYAFDFTMAEGTKVCASRAGKVVEVKEDFTEGALRADLLNKGNIVVVDHGDGTCARYLHLKPQGALVDVGDAVNAGDVIALSGATGYVSGPHLHFQVCKGRTWESLPVHFDDIPENGGVLAQGKTYTSRNTPAIPPDQREELMRLAQEAKLAWDGEAYGLAWPRIKKIADAKVAVPFPPADAAKERLPEFDARCAEALVAAVADADAGRLAPAVERLLLAKNSFANTPLAARVNDAILEMRKREGYADAVKAADRRAHAQDQFYRALQNELTGYLKGAARGYEECAKLEPEWRFCAAAAERRKSVLARLPEPAAAKR